LIELKNSPLIKFFLAFLLTAFSSQLGFAQISYQDLDHILEDGSKSYFPLGFADLDGDFRDDIIQLKNGDDFRLYRQNGSLDKVDMSSINNSIPSRGWTIGSGDLDKDGVQELIISGNFIDTRIYKNVNGNYILDQTIPSDLFAQGSNFVDINNDSWIDLFICNDVGDNRIYLNDQTGRLVPDLSVDWSTVPPSDNSGNYGSEWVDFDDDGDMDLYVAKCSQDAIQTFDPRRVNILMENDGNGNFTENAEAYNMDIQWQSWTGTFGDVDNDGDLDCYVINHDHADQLLRNVNGVYVRDEMFIGDFMYGSSIQSILRDLDNDGDLDVIITGPRDYILWNDGTGNFIPDEEPFGPVDWFSAAVGDYNSDGFYDLILSEATSISTLGSLPDRLLLATANGNNFIKISLAGCESNIDGIGSRIFAYGDWGVQRRDVRSGESYSVFNSRNSTFGLANNTEVDSIVVFWPSGNKDVYIDPEINTQHIINEGSCAAPMMEVIVDGPLSFCPGDTLMLSIDTSLPITWNNGAVDNPLVVTEGGSYYATINNGACCKMISDQVFVDTNPEIKLPKIEADMPVTICLRTEVELSIENYDQIEWSTGEMSTSIVIDEPGTYFVDVQNLECGASWSDTIVIDQFIPTSPTVDGDSIDLPGVVMLSAVGDSIHWYTSAGTDQVLHKGPTYNPELMESTNFWVTNVKEGLVTPLEVGEKTHLGATSYSGNNLNSGLIFDALSPFTLNAVNVFTDTPGSRIIELRTSAGIILQSKEIVIPADQWTRLELNFEVPVGQDLRLTTNSNHNLQNIGTVSPRLIRSFQVPLFYPFVLEDIVSINTTPQTTAYYYYFYNWEIGQGSVFCESERVKIQGIVDGQSSTNDILDSKISIFPNPTADILHVKFEKDKLFDRYQIYNTLGQEIISGNLGMENAIDVSTLINGTFNIRLYSMSSQTSYTRVFMKNN